MVAPAAAPRLEALTISFVISHGGLRNIWLRLRHTAKHPHRTVWTIILSITQYNMERKSADWNLLMNTLRSWEVCPIETANLSCRTPSPNQAVANRNSPGCTKPGARAIPRRFGLATGTCA